MARRLAIALSILALALVLAVPAGSQSPVGKLMAEKLKASQLLLEGLALGDFDKVTQNAEKLAQLSKTAEWMVHKTPRFEVHSNEFRRAAEQIIQKAREKNLDGVAYGYLDLTMTCVRCHQYVREIRDARLPVDPSVYLARRQ